MTDSTNQDQLKNWMNEWKARFEDMQVQFSLGKMDAADVFEKYKNQMRTALNGLKEQADKATDLTEEQLTKLRTQMEHLQVQLNLGKADGLDAFREQKKRIESAMESLKSDSRELFNKGFSQSMDLFDHNAKAFKTGIEILQLQFALGKMDAKDDAEKLRKELNEKVNDMQQLFGEGQKLMQHQMEEWNKQWQAGFEKMKSWADQWQKKS